VQGLTCNGSRGGYSCCTPGAGCPYNCGDQNVTDDCGQPCPFNCPSTYCCDDNRDCQQGDTSSACGTGATQNSCNDCGANSCVNHVCGSCQDGAQGIIACNGNCGFEDATCTGGQWVGDGNCMSLCTGGCCTGGNCVAGESATACGTDTGTCTDCTQWAGSQGVGPAGCQNGGCCILSNGYLGNLPYSDCCSGSGSCTLGGQCFCD
jgi:hypothetical protein